MAVNELELRLDAREVALSQLVSAASVFAALLREVAKEYAGMDRDPISWIVDLHSKPRRFAIFDVLTDKRVECFFTSHVTLDDVLRGVGRRVAVTGIIKTRPDGERVSVEARELRVFPAEEELPSPDDVRGILPRSESA